MYCQLQLMLSCAMLKYFNHDDENEAHDDAVILDDDTITIPLDYLSRPCDLPKDLYYLDDDFYPHKFTNEVK